MLMSRFQAGNVTRQWRNVRPLPNKPTCLFHVLWHHSINILHMTAIDVMLDSTTNQHREARNQHITSNTCNSIRTLSNKELTKFTNEIMCYKDHTSVICGLKTVITILWAYTVLFQPAFGTGIAASIRVGQFLAQGNADAAKTTSSTAYTCTGQCIL